MTGKQMIEGFKGLVAEGRAAVRANDQRKALEVLQRIDVLVSGLEAAIGNLRANVGQRVGDAIVGAGVDVLRDAFGGGSARGSRSRR